MIRLLIGSNSLAVYKCVEIPREQRLCTHCDSSVIEDVRHFILYQSLFIRPQSSLLRPASFHTCEPLLTKRQHVFKSSDVKKIKKWQEQ